MNGISLFTKINILAMFILVPAITHAATLPKAGFYDYNLNGSSAINIVVDPRQQILCDSCLTARSLTPYIHTPFAKPQPALLPLAVVATTELYSTTANKDSNNKEIKPSQPTVIRFNVGSAVISTAGHVQIHEAISQHPGHSAAVVGYTCQLGTQAFNDTLAHARATEVTKKLELSGVKVTKTEAAGKCCYVSENNSQNRRVEIHFTKEKGK